MKYLGIDYGSKRVGVAVSNEEGTIAFPRMTLPNDVTILSAMERLAADERVARIIVGDTRSFSGRENPVTKESDAFSERLGKATGLPVERAWEAGSSIEASRYAPEGQEHDDAAAAAFILQRYLDTKGDTVR